MEDSVGMESTKLTSISLCVVSQSSTGSGEPMLILRFFRGGPSSVSLLSADD